MQMCTKFTTRTLWIATFIICTAAAPVMARNHAIAVSGDAAPGTSDTFTAFDDPVLNDDGKVAFWANTTGESGIWSSGGGSLTVVAQEGVGAAPGIPDSLFSDLHTRRIFLNDAGDVAFEGNLQAGPGGVTFSDNSGIWASESGIVTLKFREGTPHPDDPNDTLSPKSGSTVSWARFNNSGHLLRIASLPFGESAILSTVGGLDLIAETTAGGTGITGADFSGFQNPSLSNAGDVDPG